MSKYASDTSVSPERSIEEIRQTILRFGANDFTFVIGSKEVEINFSMKNRIVRFRVQLPPMADYARTPGRRVQRSALEQQKAWNQAIRQRHRALLLVIKAKLEAVESGIETFDEAFMAHIALPNGDTVGEWYGTHIQEIYSGGTMPPLLVAKNDERGA